MTAEVCEMDRRLGGAFRFETRLTITTRFGLEGAQAETLEAGVAQNSAEAYEC